MDFRELAVAGAFEVTLAPRGDHRGYFMRTYDEITFRDRGLSTAWVQDNESRSEKRHTLRGMHYQRAPFAETKFVRAIAGRVYDAIVDLRADSPTYRRWAAVELAPELHNAIYVPRGCAHGFCTLVDGSVVVYKVDSVYSKELEGGLRWDDPAVGIDWPTRDPILSDRDRELPLLADLGNPFPGGTL